MLCLGVSEEHTACFFRTEVASSPKMQAIRSSETSLSTYTQRYNPEDQHWHPYRRRETYILLCVYWWKGMYELYSL
jgi:hypothetical protein